MRVLIVDDSVVFRTQISASIAGIPDIEVVGTASNGKLALQKLAQSSVDLMILDLEMPEMNGIQVLKELKEMGHKVKVIVFSSQSQRGAEAALDALRLGAHDVVAKPQASSGSIDSAADAIRVLLLPKLVQFKEAQGNATLTGLEKVYESQRLTPSIEVNGVLPKRDIRNFSPDIIVIGSSTGGPTALEKIFESIRGPLKIPILIVQHMPPVFTEILARRLGEQTGIPASEAKHGQPVMANHIYVAPGGYHMVIEGPPGLSKIVLHQEPQRNSVRPAVDYLFESAAQFYGKTAMGFILTGMGEDGLVGSQAIRRAGGAISIQSKESCVVFGMPGAVFQADSYDSMGDLGELSEQIRRMTK